MKILRRIFYILVFLVSFSFVAIYYAPVSLFKSTINANLPPQLNLVGLEGSLGRGKVRSISASGISLSNVSWSLNPFLLKLNIKIPAKSDWRLSLGLAFGGFKANLKPGSLDFIAIPMASLAGTFTGELNYKASFDLECKVAKGQISIDELALEAPFVTSIKDLKLNLNCQDNKTLVKVKSADKSLSADIKALIDKNSAQLSASGKLGEHQLTPLLETIVYPNQTGEFSLNQNLIFR